MTSLRLWHHPNPLTWVSHGIRIWKSSPTEYAWRAYDGVMCTVHIRDVPNADDDALRRCKRASVRYVGRKLLED